MATKPESGTSDETLVRVLQDLQNKPPVIDPTANVLKLVEQAIHEQTALRILDRYWQDKLDEQKERYETKLADATEKLALAEKERGDALREAEARRIDAQRAEDKAAVATALSSAQTETKTLAAQTETAARTLAATAGRGTGLSSAWGILLGAVGLAGLLISIYINLQKGGAP
jgi:tRNA(Met) C34 N-acetyltransferase TmcA